MINLEAWDEIDEETIFKLAELSKLLGDTDQDSFVKILASGAVMRYAGMTPIYVQDEDTAQIAVYSKELIGATIH